MTGKTTPWRLTLNEPRLDQGERSLYARGRRFVNGVAREQRISTGTMNRAEAEAHRARMEAEWNTPSMTLPGIMEARAADLTNPDTLEGHRVARLRISEVLDVPVAEVTRAALLRGRDAMRALKPPLSPETVNTYMRRAAACWRWAEERGLVDRPWPRLKPLTKGPRRKRPYTPAELDAVLAWVSEWQGGRWLPLLSLVVDTGRRVGEVCRLKGRDLDREERTVTVVQKGGTALVVPVSDAALALLEERAPDAWLFPRPMRGGGVGPARRDAVRSVVRRAIRALKIPDGERLDTHSLRRSFVSHGHRAGVPDDVLGRISGHGKPMLAHYQRETVGDDLRAAQTQVREWRAAQASSPASSPTSPAPKAGKPRKSSRSNGQRGIRTPGHVLVRTAPAEVEVATLREVPPHAARANAGARRRKAAPFSLGADPAIALAMRWDGECREAMDLLLDDEEFRAQLRAARVAADGGAATARAAREERRHAR